MRVNVYAEEMTDRVSIIEKVIDGETFTGLRFYLELPITYPITADGNTANIRGPFIHHPGDDDSAAVTFWGKNALRAMLAKGIDMLDAHHALKNQPGDAATPSE